jgi:hypothetical protein
MNGSLTLHYSDSDPQLKTRLCTWGFAPFDLKNYELLQCAFLVLKHVLALPELEDYPVSDGKIDMDEAAMNT